MPLTITPVFFGKQTIQFKVEIPTSFNNDSYMAIPEEWEDWYLKKFGYTQGVEVPDKPLVELFEEGIFHSISTIFGTWPYPTSAIRIDTIDYLPNQPAGDRLRIGVDAVNESAVNEAMWIVSINFAYSMTT